MSTLTVFLPRKSLAWECYGAMRGILIERNREAAKYLFRRMNVVSDWDSFLCWLKVRTLDEVHQRNRREPTLANVHAFLTGKGSMGFETSQHDLVYWDKKRILDIGESIVPICRDIMKYEIIVDEQIRAWEQLNVVSSSSRPPHFDDAVEIKMGDYVHIVEWHKQYQKFAADPQPYDSLANLEELQKL